MKILIIGSRFGSKEPESYYGQYVQFFDTAAGAVSTERHVSHAFFDDLIISVGDQGFSIANTRDDSNLASYDLIILRGTGFRRAFDVIKTISVYARLHSVKIINDYHAFRDSSKLTQAVQFFEHDIPVAQTVYVTNAVLTATNLPIEFPCIMKATFGAHGKDNHVVRSMGEVRKIATETPEKVFVLQTFVPNDRDYRVLIIGAETLIIERRASEGSHLNNTSQGGSATLVSPEVLPEGALNDAHRIVDALDMTIAGVDILCHAETGAYYFLEVNSQPQLMTGAFVAEKQQAITRYLKKIAN